MNLPQFNTEGYHNASVSNVTAFDKVDYLLAHGTGDDNVHFANSAHLLDMFTKARIRNYRFRMFTDRYGRALTVLALEPGIVRADWMTTVTTASRGGEPIRSCTSG